ncbi:virulence factor SrfB [Roseibium sp.]|uniref:virulence factor SrfB n=2 Tax=Roseibium sp. TaxID=1936156 RepID=UPI003264FB45
MAVKDETSNSDFILVPNSGVQFVTLKLNIERLNSFSRKFIERCGPLAQTGEGEQQQQAQWQLLKGWNSEDPQGEPEHEPAGDDVDYDINKLRALEPFLEKWVPVPYLRVNKAATSRSGQTYDDGPTNWVRVRVVEAPEDAEHADATHLATFAFDTMIDDYRPAAELENADGSAQPYVPYTEPRAADIETPRRFAFVSDMDTAVRFLADYRKDPATAEIHDYQRWVASWLEDLFTNFLRAKQRRQTLREDDFQGRKLEHVARWITFLELLTTAAAPSEARFVDTLSDQPRFKPVDVDLILDVGNSRTCGILIEDLPNQDDLGIEGCQTLEIRNIGQPHLVYREPFESHVEFAQASFGPENLSRDSGRTRAFFWPSLVRVGPEAHQLRNRNGSMDDLCGMSSPKRYLWDVAEMNQAWRFPSSDYIDGTPPSVGLKIRKHVNSSGDILSVVTSKNHRKIFESLYPDRNRAAIEKQSREFRYSRSAMYSFMLAEVIWQAFVMINNPAGRRSRSQSEVPRQLRNIILTLPTAVPTREQRIMKMRAEAAVSLIWDLLDWSANPPRGVVKPNVRVAWDEASCVQLVWLYGEIAVKFGGNIDGFFKLTGKPRQLFDTDKPPQPDAPPAPSLRIASLDIGGGTTDLMITTYFHEENRAIVPVQTFRESFRIAGDDIARSVIERIIVPAFINHLSALGVQGPRELLKYCFNNHANITKQETNQRRLFVQRVFLPVAYELMAQFEQMPPHDYGSARSLSLGELLPGIDETARDATGFIEDQIPNRDELNLLLSDIRIPFSFESLRQAVQEPLEAVMDNLCEATGHFDCDIVILSGRPSKLPAVREMVYNRLSVPTSRIVAMHEYRPGNWYPFRSHDRVRLGDPKTSAVVGGTLCALSEGRLRNFLLFTNRLQMRSTAKYIGRLESNNKLLNKNIVFSPDDLNDSAQGEVIKNVSYFTKEFYGYKQLPLERWVASPLYLLNENKSSNSYATPITISLKRAELVDEENPNELLDAESRKEELLIEEAIDREGTPARRSLSLVFRTVDDNSDSYWLDSGIISI